MNQLNASENQPYDFTRRAAVYDQHRKPGGPHADYLVQLAERTQARTVLEIGPGTGNSTQTFLDRYPVTLIGLDRSFGMLLQANQKNLDASWIQGIAESIPLPDDSVDMVFSVLVSHHIENLDSCIQECRRVLTPGGIVAMVTTAHRYIKEHFLNDYFPSFAEIDLDRFPEEHAYSALMAAAGLMPFPLEFVTRESVVVDGVYLEKIKGKFISTLDLIPEDEFNRGILELEEEINQKGQLDKRLAWEAVIVSARKSSSH